MFQLAECIGRFSSLLSCTEYIDQPTILVWSHVTKKKKELGRRATEKVQQQMASILRSFATHQSSDVPSLEAFAATTKVKYFLVSCNCFNVFLGAVNSLITISFIIFWILWQLNWVDLFGVSRSKLVPTSSIATMQKDGAGFGGFATHLDQTAAHPDLVRITFQKLTFNLIQIPLFGPLETETSDFILFTFHSNPSLF